MKKLMTKDDVMQFQFYQMPKAFFQNPKYMSLRCESKLAYMLMLDLLPLSAENNWVNQNNEVYVKISRAKLMSLLHIKGTQKAAQVMKELVDYQLIVYKKVGLNKCNEIYLYPLETHGLVGPFKKTQVKAKDGGDISDVQLLLEEQIYVEELKQRYDPELVDEIVNNMCEMYFNPSTRIGQQDQPMALVRNVIDKVKMRHIEHVIDSFKEAASNMEIFNPKRYIQTLIYNSVYEANTKMVGNIRYHFGW